MNFFRKLLGSHVRSKMPTTVYSTEDTVRHLESMTSFRIIQEADSAECCGKSQDNNHDWTSNCEVCSKCRTVRLGVHKWENLTCIRRCSVCKEEIYLGPHLWDNDKCTTCGSSRDLVARYVKNRVDLLALQNPPTFRYQSDRNAGRPLSGYARRSIVELDCLKREWEDVSGDQAGLTTGSQLIAELVERLGKPSKEDISAYLSLSGVHSESAQGADRRESTNTSERSKVIAIIEADALFGGLPIGLAGWEEVNLSACFVDFAMKGGFKGDLGSIRARAREIYTTTLEQNRVVLDGLNILLEEYSKPNTYAPNRAIVEKARNALRRN